MSLARTERTVHAVSLQVPGSSTGDEWNAVVKEVIHMPWCGLWGTTGSAIWWVLPLIGLVFMGVMFFVCFRGFGLGCMGGRRRASSEVSDLQHQVESLK